MEHDVFRFLRRLPKILCSLAICGIIGLMIIFAGFSLLVLKLYGIDVPWGPLRIFGGVFVLVRLFQVRRRLL